MVFMLTETDIRGELKELAGAGARAEVEIKARGRKAETRIINWRSGYNEKQLRGGRPKCQTEAAGNFCWSRGLGAYESWDQPSLAADRMGLARVKAVRK